MRYRFIVHAPALIALWLLLMLVNRALDPLWSSYLALIAMYATAMLGMVVLVGLSGQVSLGNGALMAVGAYAFAVTSLHWDTVPFTSIPWNGVWSVIAAGLAGVVVGVVVGWIGARLRGPYLAGLTLGLAVGIPAIAARFTDLLGGNQGLLLTVPYPDGGYGAQAATVVSDADAQAALDAALASPSASAMPSVESSSDMLSLSDVTQGASAVPMPSASPTASMVDAVTSATPAGDQSATGFVLEQWQASVAISVACIAAFVALNLVRGRQGRVWRAVRDDPIAASVSGIDPAGAKISAFVVSSLFAALAGAVYAQILAYVGPTAFGIGLSLSLLVGIVLGGRASLMGAVLGAVIIVLLPVVISHAAVDRGWSEQVGANLPTLLYGLLVIAVVLVAPAGIAGIWRRRS